MNLQKFVDHCKIRMYTFMIYDVCCVCVAKIYLVYFKINYECDFVLMENSHLSNWCSNSYPKLIFEIS